MFNIKRTLPQPIFLSCAHLCLLNWHSFCTLISRSECINLEKRMILFCFMKPKLLNWLSVITLISRSECIEIKKELSHFVSSGQSRLSSTRISRRRVCHRHVGIRPTHRQCFRLRQRSMCWNRSHSGNVLSKNKLTHDSCKYLKPFEALITEFVQVNFDRTLNMIVP